MTYLPSPPRTTKTDRSPPGRSITRATARTLTARPCPVLLLYPNHQQTHTHAFQESHPIIHPLHPSPAYQPPIVRSSLDHLFGERITGRPLYLLHHYQQRRGCEIPARNGYIILQVQMYANISSGWDADRQLQRQVCLVGRLGGWARGRRAGEGVYTC